jgi:predicted DNA-binding transcriptional regulator AlpA
VARRNVVAKSRKRNRFPPFDVSVIPNDERLIGLREVAARLSIHPITVYKKIGSTRAHDPEFPQPTKLFGRNRWRVSEIEAYIADQEQRSREAA